jgi:hypothetical protein
VRDDGWKKEDGNTVEERRFSAALRLKTLKGFSPGQERKISQ